MKHNHAGPPARRVAPPRCSNAFRSMSPASIVGPASTMCRSRPDRDPTPIQSFRTFTTDLERLADWLVACRITSVAMEATGVYWIPVYDILKARGLEVLLVNARHVKHVPGRKSDVEDCAWLRELHSVGLLRGSFRPAGPILPLRAYLRHREVLVQTAGTYVQRMQKALVEMNLLLPRVVSDIVGKTGLTILRAVVAGEHDPQVLAQHRDPHCKATPDEIAGALTGHYRPEHLFVLQQNLELFDMCQAQLTACDGAIDATLQSLTAAVDPPTTPLPRPRVTRRHGNEPHVDIRPALHHLTGVDLTQIDGLAPYSALKLNRRDRHRPHALAHRTPLHRLAHARPPEPDLRRPAPQLTDLTLGQSRRRRVADGCHGTDPGPDRARRVLPPLGCPRRQAKGPHRHRPQASPSSSTAPSPARSSIATQVPTPTPRASATRMLRRLKQRADTLGFALMNRETGEVLGVTVS